MNRAIFGAWLSCWPVRWPGWMRRRRPSSRRPPARPPEPARLGFFKYFAFHDPKWDWWTFDWGPLCPFPTVARYRGSADINAASFTCGEPPQKDRPARR